MPPLELQREAPLLGNLVPARYVIFGVLLLAVLAAGLAGLARSAASPVRVDVAFLGFTNSTAGQMLAVYKVVNIGEKTIWRLTYYHREFEQPTSVAYSHVAGPGASIRPGHHEIIELLDTPASGSWRPVFAFTPNGMHRRASDAVQVARDTPFWVLVPQRLESIEPQYIAGEWVKRVK